MAYTQSTFYCARGQQNCSGTLDAAVVHTYTSNDTSTETSALDYAPPYFGFNSDKVRNGDYLILHLSDGEGILRIIDAQENILEAFLSPPTSPLVTQTVTKQSNSFTGVWAAPIPVLLPFIETGAVVNIEIPSVTDVATGPGTITLTTPPFRFPDSDIVQPIQVIDNNVPSWGTITFTSGGSFIISPLSGPFSGIGTTGFAGTMFSYNTFLA